MKVLHDDAPRTAAPAIYVGCMGRAVVIRQVRPPDIIDQEKEKAGLGRGGGRTAAIGSS